MWLLQSFKDLCRGACAIVGLLLLSASTASAETDKLAAFPIKKDAKMEILDLVEQVSKFEFKLGELRFNSRTREIHIPAAVNQVDDILEYMLVHEHGDKVHESLLVTKVKPSHLVIAMLLCDYEPFIGSMFNDFTREGPGGGRRQGDEGAAEDSPAHTKGPPAHACQVAFAVHWKTGDEASQSSVEKWVRNTSRNTGLQTTPWAFTGSLIDRKGLQADRTGSIIALYLDPVAVFNCRAHGNRNDDGWLANTKNMPPPETSATVTLRPASSVEKGKDSK